MMALQIRQGNYVIVGQGEMLVCKYCIKQMGVYLMLEMQGLNRHMGNGWDLLMETTLSVLRCMRDYMNSVQSGE